ncbi:MAG: PrgI family protein [bacterium]|nr:PrgI family protein [bacterium]
MDEEKVIGPFTARQFLYLTGGVGVAYLAYRFLSLSMSIPLVALAGYVVFVLMKRSAPPHIDENYIKAKRYQLGSAEEYQKWLQRKIAEIQSQVSMRKQRGFVQDHELDKVREMFEIALRETQK